MPQRRAAKSPLKDARNVLRPFFGAKKALPRWKQFQAIRSSLPLGDLRQLLTFVEHNGAYRFPGLGSTFPQDPLTIPDVGLRRLTPLALGREINVHILRLNHHRERLAQSLVSLSEINARLLRHQWDEADQLILDHKATFGLSLVIIRKELLVALQKGGLAGFSGRYKLLTANAERRAWGLICHVLYDLADPAYHPSKAAKVWTELLGTWGDETSWFTRVADFEIVGATSTSASLSETLLRYSAVSLLDLTLAFWKSVSIRPCLEELAAGWRLASPEFGEILDAEFQTLLLKTPLRPGRAGAVTDVDLYQFSFFFEEVSNIARWRNNINEILFPAESRDQHDPRQASELRNAASALKDQAGGSVSSSSAVSRWLASVVGDEVLITEHSFVSSVVIAEFLQRVDSETTISENYLIALIGGADDLHEHTPVATLRALLNNEMVVRSAILTFLLRDLIFRKSRTPDNELDRRTSFMEIFRGGGRNEIVPLLKTVAEWSPRTAMQLGQVCTRGFLERLYLLMSSVKEVIETRIEICGWLIEVESQFTSTLQEEREALERELVNLDARSDLDSTRVHVDEESLREWFLDTQQPGVSRYIQTVLAEGADSGHETFLAFYRRLKETPENVEEEGDFLLETQIGSEFILLTIAEATLAAFVSDRSFGLDSYLSRRIRHGTLSGFLLTPLARIGRRIMGDDPEDERVIDQGDVDVVLSDYDEWRRDVSAKLDHARRDLIQIKSVKHPEGLVEATWRNTVNVTHLDAMMSRVRERVVEAKGDYDVFPDVHSLCWDLIERDLAQLRLYMVQGFYKPMSEQLQRRFDCLTWQQRVIAVPHYREAHASLEARVLEVCGWFIRPVFRRDSYDLKTLIGSTLSIVRELDANYRFTEEVVLDDSILINRGSFEVIGDILFVLLGNAAKHGKSGGKVQVIGKRDASLAGLVVLEVISEMEDEGRFAAASARIKEAFGGGERSQLEVAAVDEGFSGIRKILGLVRRVRSSVAKFGAYTDQDKLTISFHVHIPAEITFKRERA